MFAKDKENQFKLRILKGLFLRIEFQLRNLIVFPKFVNQYPYKCIIS
jgi:hypothetical protein